MQKHLLPTLASAAVWAAVSFSALYWGLKMAYLPSAPAPVPVAWHEPALSMDMESVQKVLSPAVPATPVPEPNIASRFTLWGVVLQGTSPQSQGQGIALVSVDGASAPKAYRLGDAIGGNYRIVSVQRQQVDLGKLEGEAEKAALARKKNPIQNPAVVATLPLHKSSHQLQANGTPGTAAPESTFRGVPPIGVSPEVPKP